MFEVRSSFKKLGVMATIRKFEDLEIWQLARAQVQTFDLLVSEMPLARDFELRNQMNASTGSVMDNIAEGFERSGNQEFKNFLIIAEGSNGEYRSQLYRCLDRKHIAPEKFDELYQRNCAIGTKLMAFITYLQHSNYKGQSRKTNTSTPSPQTQNVKHRTLNPKPLAYETR
jgi:four helix bundle protein